MKHLPARKRMAKSATSCGISCSKMAPVVNNPTRVETKKDPATARP